MKNYMSGRRLAGFMSSFLILTGFASPAYSEIVIAREGKAVARVVKAAGLIPAESTAVAELTNYLFKITGATFDVVEEKDAPASGPCIFVGPTEFAKKQGVNSGQLGKEESVIKTIGENLSITGGRPRGVLYGVYFFLEDYLGVHWLNLWCEVVPANATLALKPVDVRRKPFLEYREHYGSGPGFLPAISNSPAYIVTDFYHWVARNRLNGTGLGQNLWFKDKYNESPTGAELGGGWVPGGFPSHTFWYYFPPDEYYNKHPEFFSMRKGKRAFNSNKNISMSGNHLCLTNKELRKLLKEKVLDMFRKIPSADFVSISPNDGGQYTLCDCPECRAFVDQHGNEADLFYDCVNPIAEAVEKEFPGKMIYTLGGYQPLLATPKTIKPRDNIIAQNVAWKDAVKHIWAWSHDFSGAFFGIRYLKPSWWAMGERMRKWKQEGIPVTGLTEEDEVCYTDPVLSEMYEFHPWLTAKLADNPDADVDGLIKIYVNGCYGAAGPFLFDYFMLQKERAPLWPWRMVNFNYVDKAQKLFDQAEKAVAGDSVHLTRLKDLRINIDFVTLAWRNNIIADYLRQGGKIESYPYKKDLLEKRLLGALSATTHPYWQAKARYCFGERSSTERIMRDLALEVVKRLAVGPEYLPLPMDQLPEAARNMPPDRIVDIPLAVINYAPFEKDPEATLGLGYNFSWKQFPFETGVDRRRLSIGELGYIADPGLIGKPDVKGDGYHLYKGGRFAIDAGESLFRIYLCYTWEYQLAIDSLKPPQAGATNVWEWYVSAKFKKDAAGAYSGETLVDRVVLVDLGDAAMLEKAGQKIPPRMIQQVARWLFDGTPENRAGDAEIMRMPDARIDNPAYVEGRFGKALEIAKPSNIAVIPFDPRLTMLNKKSFTITLWFRTDRPEGGQASPKAAHSGGQVLFEQYTDPRHLISLRIRDRKTLVFESADPSGKPVEVTAESSSGNLTDGLWHLVVAGHDKETKRLFLRVDAQPLKETALAETPLVEEPIWIGGGAAGFLKGAIDEVHIYLDARPELQGGRWKD